MPINKIPQRAFSNDDMIVDTYTATAGQTAFTLTRAAAVNSLLVHVNDVIQQPTVDYTVAGTTLTMTSALSANDDVRVRVMTERPLGTQSGGSGATTLGALNDVSAATPATGQVLKWSGTTWAPAADATGGGGSSLTIQDEGVALSTAATTLNFVGSGITASGTGATKTITVSGTGGSGIALTDLSVASEGTASGDGSIAYNNSNGQFTYTPPTLNGLTNAGDVDFGSNKILYANVYANLSDLPSASSYHGMFAHVHGTGKAYYAHAGNWVPLADESQLTLDGLTGVSTTGVTSGQVLKYNGTSWAPAADSAGSSGIALGDISVGAEGTPSGDGSLAYNNSTGVFTYTPPIIPAVALPDDQEFGVTASGASAYTFSGAATGNNPTLTLQKGKTYRFDVNASGHPFQIRVSSGGSNYTNGVVNAGTQSGAVYFTVPDDAPATLVYQCAVHAAMVGTINIVNKTQIAIFERNAIATFSAGSFSTRNFQTLVHSSIPGVSLDGSGYANIPAGSYLYQYFTTVNNDSSAPGEIVSRVYDHGASTVIPNSYSIRGVQAADGTDSVEHMGQYFATHTGTRALTIQTLSENAAHTDVNTFDSSPGNALANADGRKSIQLLVWKIT